MMFLNMARAPYLPYVDVEVANNAAFVSEPRHERQFT
jgi:hypothetical protein